jgi:hypothetical protein
MKFKQIEWKDELQAESEDFGQMEAISSHSDQPILRARFSNKVHLSSISQAG